MGHSYSSTDFEIPNNCTQTAGNSRNYTNLVRIQEEELSPEKSAKSFAENSQNEDWVRLGSVSTEQQQTREKKETYTRNPLDEKESKVEEKEKKIEEEGREKRQRKESEGKERKVRTMKEIGNNKKLYYFFFNNFLNNIVS